MGEFKVGNLTAAEGTKVQTYLEVQGTPVKLPITLINGSKPGKTVVITGGTHGGEYSGVETSIRLAKNLDPQDVSGQIAIIHPANVPAFTAKLQYIGPYDGQNLNREYPGLATGTVTQRIAYTISSLLFTQADFYMDLHGGDIHEALTPFVLYSKLGNAEQTDLSLEAAKAFGVKYVCGSVSDKSTYGCAAAMGVPGWLGEMGSCGLWSEEEVQTYTDGISNVLRLLEVLPGKVVENKEFHVVDHMEGLRAAHTGCWYPCVKIDDLIKKGQKVGEIRDYFGNPIGEYFSPCTGHVLYVVTSLPINEGDPLISVSYEETKI